MNSTSVLSAAALAVLMIALPPAVTAAPSGEEIILHCDLETYPGQDQRSTLTVIVRDAAGNERRDVYKRYWIDNKGRDQVVDKMMLFTEFPPDASGTAFMRWGYLPEAGKNADQWLYLPSLNTLRRVSVRDPGDSFLGSDLNYQDISYRPLDADEHKLLREEVRDGQAYYVVESRAKERNPLYGRVLTWATKADDWADCNIRRIEFYDTRDSLIKVQTLDWQRVGDAWVWDEVVVENARTGGMSIFRVTNAEVNVGLEDRMFSERTMRRGVR
jgi:hypothetical protein